MVVHHEPGIVRAAASSVFLVHGRHKGARDETSVLLAALGLKIIGWRQARQLTGVPSPTTLEIVQAGIESAACVVVLLTGDDVAQLKPHFGEEPARAQPRPNVIFEAGWALATAGPARTVLVAVDSVDLMSDIDGLNFVQLENTPAARRDFAQRLRDAGCDPDTSGDGWLDPAQGGDFRLTAVADVERDEPLPEDKLGGLFTEYVVDSAFNLQFSHAVLYQEMADAIRQREPLALKFHYVGTRMAQYWGGVCREETYGHDLLTDTTSEAIEDIVTSAGVAGETVNFISLGPGDGRADVFLLNNIQRHVSIDFCYLVDMSLDLLQQAVSAVMREARTAERSFRIKAIVADFERNLATLEPFFNHDETAAFYALTGYTLGNSREDATIEALHRIMRPGDLLLVDARLHDAGRASSDSDLTPALKRDLVRPYSSDAVKRFAFGPVEIASDFAVSWRDVEFGHEIHVGRTTSVSGGINVFLNCSGLEENEKFADRFLTRYTLQRYTSRFRRPQSRPLQLATVTYYDFDALAEWFALRGFQVVWQQRKDGVGLFLLSVGGAAEDS